MQRGAVTVRKLSMVKTVSEHQSTTETKVRQPSIHLLPDPTHFSGRPTKECYLSSGYLYGICTKFPLPLSCGKPPEKPWNIETCTVVRLCVCTYLVVKQILVMLANALLSSRLEYSHCLLPGCVPSTVHLVHFPHWIPILSTSLSICVSIVPKSSIATSPNLSLTNWPCHH